MPNVGCFLALNIHLTWTLTVDPLPRASDGQQPLSSGPLSAREERSWDYACQRWNGGGEGKDWEATREMRLTSGRALGEWCPLGMLWFFLTERKHRLMEGRQALQVAYLTWSWLWDLRALGLGSNYSILWNLVSSQVKRRLINLFSNTPCLWFLRSQSAGGGVMNMCSIVMQTCAHFTDEKTEAIFVMKTPKDTSPLGRGLKSASFPLSLLHHSSSLHSSHFCQSQSHLLSSCARRGPEDTGLLPIRLPRERVPDAFTVVSWHILFLSIFLKLPWVIFFQVKSSWKEWNKSKTNTV